MTSTITETATAFSSLSVEDTSKYSYKNLTPYSHPPETREDLPWAELVTLDLSDFSNAGGKERLASQLSHAVHHVGFFYVKNFGLSQEEIDNQFTLGKNLFNLPVEDKEKYEIDYANADYNGWRRPGRHVFEDGKVKVKDNVEIYNIPKFTKDFERKVC